MKEIFPKTILKDRFNQIQIKYKLIKKVITNNFQNNLIILSHLIETLYIIKFKNITNKVIWKMLQNKVYILN